MAEERTGGVPNKRIVWSVAGRAPTGGRRTTNTGVRDLIVYCADYKYSHNVKLASAVVDRWPDDLRLSDLEPRFVCKVCGKRGAFLRHGSDRTKMRFDE